MRLWLAAVGRVKPGPEKTLFEDYAKRLQPPLTLCEVEEKRPLPIPERKSQEAKLLLAAIPDKAKIVALDERGAALTSAQLAHKIEFWRDDGVADLAFLIGGADGHDPIIRDKADLVLSLSAMTWPHRIVRILVAEQLWRAHSILSCHPYHRD